MPDFNPLNTTSLLLLVSASCFFVGLTLSAVASADTREPQLYGAAGNCSFGFFPGRSFVRTCPNRTDWPLDVTGWEDCHPVPVHDVVCWNLFTNLRRPRRSLITAAVANAGGVVSCLVAAVFAAALAKRIDDGDELPSAAFANGFAVFGGLACAFTAVSVVACVIVTVAIGTVLDVQCSEWPPQSPLRAVLRQRVWAADPASMAGDWNTTTAAAVDPAVVLPPASLHEIGRFEVNPKRGVGTAIGVVLFNAMALGALCAAIVIHGRMTRWWRCVPQSYVRPAPPEPSLPPPEPPALPKPKLLMSAPGPATSASVASLAEAGRGAPVVTFPPVGSSSVATVRADSADVDVEDIRLEV